MLGILFVYPTFIAICVAAFFRPWIGVVGFYGFVLLEPNWNWRWSIPRDQQFQPYIAAATLIGFLLLGFRGNQVRGKALLACGCLVTFLLLAYVSATQSINPTSTAFYMSNFWKIILMAMVAVVLLDSPKKIYTLLWVLVLAQGYSALRINEQYFQDGVSIYAFRPWGTKGDNNLYTIMTVPLIGCSAALALHAQQWWKRGLAGTIFILQVHQVMLMESRGGMLATIGMMGMVLFRMPRNRYTLSAAGIGLAMAMVLAGPPVVREFMSSFEAEEDLDASAQSRFKLWKAGWAITADYPLLGVGPYAGSRLVPKYYEGGLPGENKGLHNLLFEISTGCGVPAAILYFSFFGLSWYCVFGLYRRRSLGDDEGEWLEAAKLAVYAGLPGYLAASMFSSGAMLESSYVLASAGLATWMVTRQLRAQAEWDAEHAGESDDELAAGVAPQWVKG